MDPQRREQDPVGADLRDRDAAGEETETPDGLERGGPAGTLPTGPRGADVERKPIGEWADEDDTEGFGARQPPGG
jgi:hypothetical protein